MAPHNDDDAQTNCVGLERKILRVEYEVLKEIDWMKREIGAMRGDINKLVTKPEFEPVRLIAFGGAGGVLVAALGAVMAKVIGW